ncbi:MAG: extracellular solute-binding protein [Chloroflexia bacterium]|jgi:raffinose/stachyose/melibiose transport system substrate-binding protein|nr:extracellular solute-binding protein [Chloroflexia bacterium]MDQ3614341.1 extracellular solute-binding protein [Chloroflexota bacterium]
MISVSRRTFVAGAVSAPLLASTRLSLASAAQDGAQGDLSLAGIEYSYSPAVVEAFQEANPNLAVDFTGGTISFEDGQIQAVLQSGEGPDAVNVNSGPGRVGLLASSGLILALDDFYERTGAMETYQPNVIEQIQNQPPEGETIYEVVEGLDVFSVYYNMDIFEENGLEPPQTWDDFLAICQTLQDAGVQPMLLGARDNFQGGWLFGNLVQASAGRDVMTEVIYGEGDFTHPDILRAAEMLQTLVDEGYISGLEAAALEGEQAQAAFGQGQGAMTVQQQSFPISLANDGAAVTNIGSFVIPSLNEGQPAAPTAGLAHSWVLNASSDNPEAAEAWLEWVVSDEYLQIAYENGGGLVPARIVPEGITLPPSVQSAADSIEEGVGYNPSVYLPSAGTNAWYAAMQQIITGQATPEEVVAEVQAALEESRAG